MSTTIMALCWPLVMPPTQKSVLISLADNANDAGDCWPSINTICNRTCFGRTAVIDAIKWLEEKGALVAHRGNGRHSKYKLSPASYSNQYACRTGTPAEPVRLTDKTSPPAGKVRAKPVRQTDSNRKEEASKSNRQCFDLSSWPEQPSEQVLADWISMRKRLKADVSATVIAGFGTQLKIAKNAGVSVDTCLTECIVRNWRGFKFSWLQNDPVNQRRGYGSESAYKPLPGEM